MKNSVIIYSGGMDSTTLLHHYKDDIALAISFDYSSNHNDREYSYAKQHTEQLGIEHIRIDVTSAMSSFNSALLNGAEAIPEGHYDEDSMAKTVVPFRNGIMLSLAAGIAESRGLENLLIANHFGDDAQYPDCRASFIDPMQEAIKAGTSNGVQLRAPYTSVTKEEIALLGFALNIDYSTTWSCYKADEDIHCGKCGTCVERVWALRHFGDPTDYKDKAYAINLLKETGEW